MLDSILDGQMVMPEGTASEPFIDIDDIADVVVASIMEPGLHNRLFEVTGPRLLSFADCAAEISAASGHEVELLEVPMETYIQSLRDQQLPEELIAICVSCLETCLMDATPILQKVLNRPSGDQRRILGLRKESNRD